MSSSVVERTIRILTPAEVRMCKEEGYARARMLRLRSTRKERRIHSEPARTVTKKRDHSVYVVGTRPHAEPLALRADTLEKEGYRVSRGLTQTDKTIKNNAAAAEGAINAIDACDVLVLILDGVDKVSEDVFACVGAALAIGKTVVAFCPHTDRVLMHTVMFYHPAIIHFSEWRAVVRFLRGHFEHEDRTRLPYL
jgi:hypothetical protein